jgi:hypothetical protein
MIEQKELSSFDSHRKLHSGSEREYRRPDMLSKLESKECILSKSNDKSTEHAPHSVSKGK